jgi:hypothetical protein
VIVQYNHEVTQIIARLQNLEHLNRKLVKQNLYLKIAGLITILMIVMVITMGQSSSNKNIIESQGFVLCDKVGNARAKLILKEDEPLFIIFDKDKQERLILTVKNDDPCIVLRNKRKFNQVALFVMEDSPRFIMFDKDNKPIFRAPEE